MENVNEPLLPKFLVFGYPNDLVLRHVQINDSTVLDKSSNIKSRMKKFFFSLSTYFYTNSALAVQSMLYIEIILFILPQNRALCVRCLRDKRKLLHVLVSPLQEAYRLGVKHVQQQDSCHPSPCRQRSFPVRSSEHPCI